MVEENRLTRSSARASSTCSSGAGWWSRPRLPAVDLHLRLAQPIRRRRPGQLSDSFYCNPEYDKLYEQQKVTIDPAKRAEIVKQMQRMLYDDAPYVVTYYYDDPRPTAATASPASSPSPTPTAWSCSSTAPTATATSPRRRRPASGDDGGGVPLVPIAVGVAVVGAAGVLLAMRRRSTQDERE